MPSGRVPTISMEWAAPSYSTVTSSKETPDISTVLSSGVGWDSGVDSGLESGVDSEVESDTESDVDSEPGVESGVESEEDSVFYSVSEVPPPPQAQRSARTVSMRTASVSTFFMFPPNFFRFERIFLYLFTL